MSPSQDSSKITILIAEDESPVREVVQIIFNRYSDRYSLLIAKDGQEAIDIADQYKGKIDLLISDVQMPGMTGPDLAREIKRTRPDIRIMLMSGYSQGVLLLDHGWNFLPKPFLPKAILDKIEEILITPVSSDTHNSPN